MEDPASSSPLPTAPSAAVLICAIRDGDAVFVHANDAACALFRAERDALLATGWRACVTPAAVAVAERLGGELLGGRGLPDAIGIRLRRADGTELDATATLVIGEHAGALAVYAFLRPAAAAALDPAAVLRELLGSDRTASVVALAAGLAYEVDRPLAYASGALEALQERLERGERVGPEALSLVVDTLEATRRAVDIVHDLRTLTDPRSGPGGRELPELVHAAARVAAARVGSPAVRLTVERVPAAPAPETRVEHVVLWLCLAAVRLARSRVGLGVAVEGEQLRLHVRHDGDHPSTDVDSPDLAIARSLVVLLGGELSVSDGDGVTHLRATLPTHPARRDGPAARRQPRPRVLVIDDEPAVAGIVAAHLGSCWPVDICTDPVRALALLRQGGTWSAVVCDIRMEPLSGPELYGQLCETAPQWRARFVFVSAGTPTAAEAAILAEGDCPFLSKRTMLRELPDAVAARIATASASASEA